MILARRSRGQLGYCTCFLAVLLLSACSTPQNIVTDLPSAATVSPTNSPVTSGASEQISPLEDFGLKVAGYGYLDFKWMVRAESLLEKDSNGCLMVTVNREKYLLAVPPGSFLSERTLDIYDEDLGATKSVAIGDKFTFSGIAGPATNSTNLAMPNVCTDISENVWFVSLADLG